MELGSRSTGSPSGSFRAGWLTLVGLSALSAVSYVVLSFVVPDLLDGFVAWAALSVYALVVLLIPYRRGERWAWYLTWVLPVPSVVLALNNLDAGAPFYFAAAGLMAAGQLLTRRSFA